MEKKFNIYKISTIVLAVVLVVILIIWGKNKLTERDAQQDFSDLASQVNRISDASADNAVAVEATEEADTEVSGEVESTEEESDSMQITVPLKNLDWEEMATVNSDIYAWIYVPGTNIDYPVLQHPSDDSYYLNYNMNGTRGYPGCIYTERLNSKDFLDFNTVVYGHNMRDQSMFSTLHYFEDNTFFVNCPYAYIYTGDEVLLYEIFAAYAGDNAHILNTNDFTTTDGRQQYIDTIIDNARKDGNLREETADTLTTDSRILTLSTCISGKASSRYLVQAVLVSEAEL